MFLKNWLSKSTVYGAAEPSELSATGTEFWINRVTFLTATAPVCFRMTVFILESQVCFTAGKSRPGILVLELAEHNIMRNPIKSLANLRISWQNVILPQVWTAISPSSLRVWRQTRYLGLSPLRAAYACAIFIDKKKSGGTFFSRWSWRISRFGACDALITSILPTTGPTTQNRNIAKS